MNLNPSLSRADRVASFAVGIFLLLTPLLDPGAEDWRQIALPVTGLIFVIGAVGGT